MVQSLVNCTRYNKICSTQSFIFRSIILHFYCHDTKNSNGNPVDSKTENSVTINRKKDIDLAEQSTSLPEPPTTCCMTGCANCVWIEYAEKLSKLFNDGGEKAKKKILDSVTDSNMRAFLLMELRNMKPKL